ncbi:MAG: ComEC family competence protein, partial [Candidatus Latescibacterota bacterium]
MKRRPALHLLLLTLPGILAADRIEIPPALPLAASSVLFLALLASWRAGWTRASRAALVLLPSLLFLVRAASVAVPGAPSADVPVELRARVVMGGGTSARSVRAKALDGPLRGRIVEIRMPEGDPLPSPGRTLRIAGRMRPLPLPRNPGEPDRNAANRRRGDAARIDPEQVALEPGGSALEPVRERVRGMAESLGGSEGALFLALFLADRSTLEPELTEAFRVTGLTHLLALSGINIGILYCVFSAPLSLIAPRRAVPILTVLLLWAFGAVASLPISLLRALIMASVLAAGRLVERPLDGWNTLAFAALLSIAGDPGAPWDVSFRLSFAATAGIVAAARPLGFHGSCWWKKWIVGPIGISIAAQASTMPIVLRTFGTFAPFGAIATLLASPFNALALAAGTAWILLAGIHGTVDGILEDATWGTALLFRLAVERIARSTPPLPVLTGPTA